MILDFSISDLNKIKVGLDMASNSFYSIALSSLNPFEIDMAKKHGKEYHLLSDIVKNAINDAYMRPYN